MNKEWNEIRLRIRKSKGSDYIMCDPGSNIQLPHQFTSGVVYWCEKCRTHVCCWHWKPHDYNHILERIGGEK